MLGTPRALNVAESHPEMTDTVTCTKQSPFVNDALLLACRMSTTLNISIVGAAWIELMLPGLPS